MSVVMPWGVRTCSLIVILLAVLLTGCDGPLAHDTLIDRLGTGRYSTFHITFYRYHPGDMRAFLAGLPAGAYAYDEIVSDGPIERLQLVYTPRNHRVAVTRTGNDLDVSRRLVTRKSVGGRGPVEDVIRALKGAPGPARSWFARDLFRQVDSADPEYFRGFDRHLRRRLDQQTGDADWHLIEFSLTYPLPQAGAPVYTAEAALLPLTSTGEDGLLVSALLSLADREYAKLPDPLVESPLQ